jgi:oligoribonuclease NrnB/cAMP/cGMP phosphodiesterase (DHH superfamily)
VYQEKMRNSDAIKSNRIFSITHEQDVDGLFCAAILKNTFRNTLVFLTNHGHQNMKRVADVLATNVTRSKKSGTIIFSDLSINSLEDVDTIEKSSFKAKEYGWNIVWLDHHYWNEETKKRVQSFSKLILSPEHEQKCAAELVYQQFAKDRTACRRMAEFAHVVDFRLPGVHNLPPLPEIITYYRSMPDAYSKLQQLIEKFSRGIFWDEDLQEEYDSKYLPLKEDALLSALNSLSLHNIGNYVIAVAESPKVIAKSILAEKIFAENPEAIIVVLFSPDGKISIRRKPGANIRCDVIASKLNGGGHSYAAGATITRKNSNFSDYNNNNNNIHTKEVVQALQMVIESGIN